MDIDKKIPRINEIEITKEYLQQGQCPNQECPKDFWDINTHSFAVKKKGKKIIFIWRAWDLVLAVTCEERPRMKRLQRSTKMGGIDKQWPSSSSHLL